MAEQDLRFSDFLKELDALGKGEWITIYAGNEDHLNGPVFYSALISENRVGRSLEDPSWDLMIGNGRPGFSFRFEDEKEIASYYRCSDDGVEPIIMWRDFHGIRESYWDVSEELRLYFNLYEDRPNHKFLLINDNGDEEDAVLLSDKIIRVKGRLIREFAAAKNMRLAIFFDEHRFSERSLEDLGIEEYQEVRKGTDFVISIGARSCKELFIDKNQAQGFLLGKKLIAGLSDFKPSLRGREEMKFVDFIIGVDADGGEIEHTCDEDKLANYFGKNPGSPQYLTPVFFRKEVLAKYYSQPGKYSVEDGYLRCGGLWGLRMDNNRPKSAMVFLGDLSHLSHTEQLYWRTFNIPSGKMSRTGFERSFEGKFADPEDAAFFFKQTFSRFQDEWQKKFGWELFRPMAEGDAYHLRTLRVPLTNEQKEFDDQVLTLAKLIIDSLNEAELARGLKIEKDTPRGLDKFEAFLAARKLVFPEMLEFLRKLQALRSSATAHRKGEKYQALKQYFAIGKKDLSIVFEDILVNCVRTLNTLENQILTKE
jgi:hypothetical protein